MTRAAEEANRLHEMVARDIAPIVGRLNMAKTEKKKLAQLPEPEREIGRLVRKLWRTLGIGEGEAPRMVHFQALGRLRDALQHATATAQTEVELPFAIRGSINRASAASAEALNRTSIATPAGTEAR